MGCSDRECDANMIGSMPSDLDILPEVLHAFVIVLVSRPFRAIHGDQTGELHAAHGLNSHVLDLVNILLADLLTLLAVIDVVTCDSGRNGEEDEPVARR